MKKSEKGFTLVELLAVIAILAILVIIALPNVINMYTRARYGAFESEAKSLYKSAQQKFMANQLDASKASVRTFATGGSDELDLQGGSSNYCIRLDDEGKVVSYKVSNGSYSFSSGSSSSTAEIAATAIKACSSSNEEADGTACTFVAKNSASSGC